MPLQSAGSGSAAGRQDEQRQLRYSAAPASFEQTLTMVRQMEEARWALQVHPTNNRHSVPTDFARRLLQVLDTQHTAGPAM